MLYLNQIHLINEFTTGSWGWIGLRSFFTLGYIRSCHCMQVLVQSRSPEGPSNNNSDPDTLRDSNWEWRAMLYLYTIDVLHIDLIDRDSRCRRFFHLLHCPSTLLFRRPCLRGYVGRFSGQIEPWHSPFSIIMVMLEVRVQLIKLSGQVIARVTSTIKGWLVPFMRYGL